MDAHLLQIRDVQTDEPQVSIVENMCPELSERERESVSIDKCNAIPQAATHVNALSNDHAALSI